MYGFQASLLWGSLVYFAPFGGSSVAPLHKAKGGAELVLLIYLIAQGICWGHLAGKGLHTGFFFLGFLLIGKGWDVIQGFSSVFSTNNKAECQGMAFSAEGQCSALKWCGGFDGPSRTSPGFHGIQAGFVPMVEMGSLGFSCAIKACWDSGCV